MTNKERGLPPLSKEDLALLKNYVASQGLPEQVEAITSEAPLTVVGAGAGTGKTWTLAWRFVWTVLTREDVRHMLTLTFTEKAASEMRRRIAALLADLEPALRPSCRAAAPRRWFRSIRLISPRSTASARASSAKRGCRCPSNRRRDSSATRRPASSGASWPARWTGSTPNGSAGAWTANTAPPRASC